MTERAHETDAGYLHPRGAMVGELSLAFSSRVRRLRGRAGKALSSRPRPSRLDPDHCTQHTRLGVGETTNAKKTQTRRHFSGQDFHPPTTTKRPTHSQRGQKRPRPGVLSALIFLGSNASLLPVFCSAPLPVPAGSFQKRGVPSRPPPRAPRGGRENHSWHRSRRSIPPKSGHHFS